MRDRSAADTGTVGNAAFPGWRVGGGASDAFRSGGVTSAAPALCSGATGIAAWRAGCGLDWAPEWAFGGALFLAG